MGALYGNIYRSLCEFSGRPIKDNTDLNYKN